MYIKEAIVAITYLLTVNNSLEIKLKDNNIFLN